MANRKGPPRNHDFSSLETFDPNFGNWFQGTSNVQPFEPGRSDRLRRRPSPEPEPVNEEERGTGYAEQFKAIEAAKCLEVISFVN